MGTEETEDVEEQKEQKRNEEYKEKDHYPSGLGTEEADDEKHEAVVEEQRMAILSQSKLSRTSLTLHHLMSNMTNCFKKWEGKGNKLN